MSHFSVQWVIFLSHLYQRIELSVFIGCRNWQKQEAIKRNKQLVLSVLIFKLWNNFNPNHVLLINCY